MDVSEAKQFFRYDPDTGFLFRIARNHKTGRLGQITNKDNHGYIIVIHRGRRLKAHRLAWLLKTGELPRGQIDHINGIRDDNRWCNLRTVTPAENAQNSRVRVDSKSGVTGVAYLQHCDRWMAYINAYGVRRYIGYFTRKEDAISARKAAELLYHPVRSA